MTPATRLVCAGCGASPPAGEPYPFRCPNADAGDGRDHVLARVLDASQARFADAREAQPFARHRAMLHAHTRASAHGLGDDGFVALVGELDAAVAAVDGRGFSPTPFAPSALLADRLGLVEVWMKDETGNVSGSHKARHLFGLALHLEVSERGGLTSRAESDRRGLAIASCGNAALAAAVVARATRRPLRVFIPTDANPAVVRRLHALGARIAVCPRQGDRAGDPCVHAFDAARRAGALPFAVQGNENGLAVEGGQTLGWEMAEVLHARGAAVDRLFVQVGGGALASACVQALRDARALGRLGALPRLHVVQTRGAWPLRRGWARVATRALRALGARDAILPADGSGDAEAAERLARPEARGAVDEALHHARAHRAEFMWPWESAPHSLAHGILDDETYDWAAVVEGLLETGGWPVTAEEPTLAEARGLAHAVGVRADATGAAGLAGLLELRARGGVAARERVAVLLTGVER